MEYPPPLSAATTVTAIHFGAWVALPLSVDGPLRDASRTTAEAIFATLLQAQAQRCDALVTLAKNNHVEIPGVATAGSAAALGGWLKPRLPLTVGPADPRGYGLATDIALWLGSGIIAAAPRLHWQLLTSHKKSTGYQRAVLTGFARVDDPHYYVDIAHFVAAWVDYAIRQRAAREDFLATIFTTTLADA